MRKHWILFVIICFNTPVLAQKPDTWNLFAKTKFEPKFNEKLGEYLFYPTFTDDVRKLEGKEVTLEGFYDIYNEIIHKDRAQRMEIPGMIEMRVDMIVVACCLIRFLLDRYTFSRIRVSTYSLKEGVLAAISKKFT